ncbi:hypothetical protein H7F36_04225 [Variovorax sp. PAMC28562]|uniref:hypothetical protein n=1 Tax=Variovorax sp. PAMC28562 TaxID=2762323 RepID=UPI00164E24F4|nr:hypothetical protein [Variovorax sp. PAMC28562]QNK74451.1 hypothetical protein H7F36_04225 [Variovorax sp. PAMC28562]
MHAVLDFWRLATALVLIITLAACGGGGSSGAGSVSAAGLSKGTVPDSSTKDGTAAATPGAADAATQSPEVRYAP